jgi:DNA polymerase sigma
MEKLVLILKLFLSNRKMNEVFSGGLSSYSLTMLVVNFFQLHERSEARNPDTNLGVLLLEFFELYGCRFNYHRVGIRIRNNGEYVPKDRLRHQIGSNSTSLLCIEDPICRTNELSRSTFAMPVIQSAFESAFSRLNFECGYGGLSRLKRDHTPSLLGLIVRVPDHMITFRKHLENVFLRIFQQTPNKNLEIKHKSPQIHAKPPTPGRQTNGNIDTNPKTSQTANKTQIKTQIRSIISSSDHELISLGSSDSSEESVAVIASETDEEVS